ncbi:class I SAM-dependent methyltransferase (plasmid) [Streptosporangium sp. CA-135522]|uniref:class I SAM-dependent methyltransferase n=1 Tax=Streptosporangium sp. CA-135522 TaxID=3240072 RepID=UPI003D8A9BEE
MPESMPLAVVSPVRKVCMPTFTDYAAYWDHHAQRVPEETPADALRGAVGWTQYAGHGTGMEILGHPATALELGSGRGNAVAALASREVRATGVDFSPDHCAQARTRWSHLPGARFAQADVLDYLAAADQR